MKKTIHIVCLVVALVCTNSIIAQQLTVLDYNTKSPIYGVHIYNLDESKSTVTDSLGVANISAFGDEELIIFSHTSYTMVLFKKQDLYTSRYQLELHPTILNLDEFVISANKRLQAKEEVPNRLVSITSKDVKLNDPQTAADLIASSGQVYVQKSQLGGGSPMIRGFSANKVLIVVDGVRMNNAIFREGNLQNVISIDPNLLEKSEVVFGPSSVIYGSDALGGVMDFHTLSTMYSDSGTRVEGNVMARYSSANQEFSPHVDFRLGTKKFSSVSSFSWSKYDDLKMGKYGPDEYLRSDYVEVIDGEDTMVKNKNPLIQTQSGYSSYSLFQKFGYKVNNKLQLTYNLIYSNTSDIPRYDRLIQRKNDDTLKYARWDYGPQKWLMNNLSIKLNAPNGAFDNLNVTLAVQNFEESRIDRKFGDSAERTRTENVDMYSANFDFDNTISGRTTMFYGLESVFNKVHSKGISTDENVVLSVQSRYPDGSEYFSNAAYINFKVNHSKKTTMVFGMRYNQITINAELDTTYYKNADFSSINQNTGALTGSFGVAHRPNKTWQTNLNFSSGFKAPNIDDLAKVFDSEPGNVVVPNPELKPEYLYSIDGLVDKKFGKDLRYLVEVSGFYSFLVNAMVRRNTQVNGQDSILYDGELSQVQSLVNVGSANLAGVSVKLAADITSTIKVSGNLTYTYGKDNEGFYLRHVSPLFSNLSVIFSREKWRINTYLNYNGSIKNSHLALTELGKPDIYIEDENGLLYSPSWYTVNIKGALFLSKNIMITAGVENITNQRYRTYSSGIASPGTNFIGSVKATF